jgi:hypothetical protein
VTDPAGLGPGHLIDPGSAGQRRLACYTPRAPFLRRSHGAERRQQQP